MKPAEVFDCEFWMINSYLIGYREKTKLEQADIVRLAYQTAAFNNSKTNPRSLTYYINQIMNVGRKKDVSSDEESIRQAKEMDQRIEEEQRKEVEEDGD